MGIHKEQIKQHSLTIVNFEKEVNRLRQKESELMNKLEKSGTTKETVLTRKPTTPPPQPQPKIIETINSDALTKQIDTLK